MYTHLIAGIGVKMVTKNLMIDQGTLQMEVQMNLLAT